MPSKPELQAQVNHCQTYHTPFDQVAVAFYQEQQAALQAGGVADFDAAFSNVEGAQRESMLNGFFDTLPPKEKLELIGQLTGDVATRAFLTELAEQQTRQEMEILKVKTEAQASRRLDLRELPVDTQVGFYLNALARVKELEGTMTMASMPWGRLLAVRIVDDEGTCKVLDEQKSCGYLWRNEQFDINAVVRVGSIQQRAEKKSIEPYCRQGESMGTQVCVDADEEPRSAIEMALNSIDGRYIPIVLTDVKIDGKSLWRQ